MLRLKIKSVKHGESYRDFNDQAEIDAFLVEKGDHFGRLAYVETIPAIIDDQGVELQPEQIINHDATVEYIVEDVSEEYARKDERRVNKAARRIDLENIKWNEINSIAELKQIVKHLVNEITDKD
jgi:hypothetical protein